MKIFHHRKASKDTVSPLSHIASHTSTSASPLTLTTSHSSTKTIEAYKIETITTLDEFEQLLENHHHKHVVVFCLPTHHKPSISEENSEQKEPTAHKEGDFDEEAWYGHYSKLNNMHFVKVHIDQSEELEKRLQPKVKPSWFTFHKGVETGWASGGLKRFVHVHSGRTGSV